jgi:hypothetical protein
MPVKTKRAETIPARLPKREESSPVRRTLLPRRQAPDQRHRRRASLADHIAECSLCQGASKQFGALFREVGAYLKGEAPDTEA